MFLVEMRYRRAAALAFLENDGYCAPLCLGVDRRSPSHFTILCLLFK